MESPNKGVLFTRLLLFIMELQFSCLLFFSLPIETLILKLAKHPVNRQRKSVVGM